MNHHMKRFFFPTILVLLILIVPVLIFRHNRADTTLDQICKNEAVSFWGLDANSTEGDLEKVLRISYEQYTENIVSAYETKNFDSVSFTFEGKASVFTASFHNETLRSIMIDIIDDDTDKDAWKAYSDLIIGKLEKLSSSSASLSYYSFTNAEIFLEFGPVDASEYEINEDGTTSWSGETGGYGTKITDITIHFT